MAKKKQADAPDKPKGSKSDKDLLVRIRKRFQLMEEADHENRVLALEDIKFVNLPGWQWDENMKKERGQRPCYEFNKVRVSGKRVINEIRANRPQGKIRAVEDGDKDTAEKREGICRNIWNVSDGDTIVDYAAEYQVNGGMGAWRVATEYASDDVFEQDIVIEAIKNPFNLYCDPSAKDFMKRDAEDWFLADRISKSAYESRWPNKSVVDFDGTEFDTQIDWQDENTVRIGEYWYKEPYECELWLLQDGRTIDAKDAQKGDVAIRKRQLTRNKIMMCIASGEAILEGPTEFPGTNFPFVMVFGEHVVIDGKTYWWGLPRFGKDAQRSYNIAATSMIETIANAPKEYSWVTAKQIEGDLATRIMESHQKNYPVRIYQPDAQAPGPPIKVPAADVPVALIQQMQIGSQDIRETLGIHEASFGQESNEKSGVALRAKQSQAELVTYNYPDNMAKGIQRTWEIMDGLIPFVYDSQRNLRVLGADGDEDYVTINQKVVGPTGEAQTLNDMTAGKYDVVVTVGPGYATKRLEAADTYLQMAQAQPEIMGVAGDLIFKSLDAPYADDIAERLRVMLPPPIQQLLTQDKPVPPEVQAVMARAQQAMQQVQQQGQLVQQAAQELQTEKATADKAKSDVQLAIANLKTAQAQFDAHVAETKANLQQQSLDIQLQQHGTEQQGAKNELAQAVADIKQWAADFAQTNTQILQEIMGKQQTQVIVPPAPPKPRIARIRATRVNGQLEAQPIYEDQMPQMPMMNGGGMQ